VRRRLKVEETKETRSKVRKVRPAREASGWSLEAIEVRMFARYQMVRRLHQ